MTDLDIHPPFDSFRRFDRRVQRRLGADMRLLYGLSVPILAVVGLIAVLGLSPSPWLVAAGLGLEVIALGVVLVGFSALLGETDDSGDRPG
ncbi:MAG TPA: hypothetical protein VFN55_04190 [Solirubrobacteraceae bacterium]|nr:hypothetical protein [Solirubrobacteraceae bacterium]